MRGNIRQYLATSHASPARVLAVLANTTVAGRDVASSAVFASGRVLGAVRLRNVQLAGLEWAWSAAKPR